MKNLIGEIIGVDELSVEDHDAMFGLMTRHYANLTRDAFEADLNDKHWVIRLIDPTIGALYGFSTQSVMFSEVDGRPIRALFSGDTIVAPAYWGRNPLAGLWGQLALSLIDQDRDDELYWFLISKGYKTYRFLPVFFHEYYPHFGRGTPPSARHVIDALATTRFRDTYDKEAGLIRAGVDGCRLRQGVAQITPRRLKDPHVRFFARRNPGHIQGDELCCLAPLTRENFKTTAYRVIEQARLSLTVS
ncbi:MAG TPA: hypothetical protein VMX74_14215 [Pirellulales bacterium]|nr:hypothetical protein [Pirellulales bacterium]